jgi:hypothetical protein
MVSVTHLVFIVFHKSLSSSHLVHSIVFGPSDLSDDEHITPLSGHKVNTFVHHQHILTEPTNHLDTLSMGLGRHRCKCNDIQSANNQERRFDFCSIWPVSVAFSYGLLVFILYIGMISIKPDRVPSPDPLLEEVIQTLQAKGWIADTLNNLTRTRSNSRYNLSDSVLLMPNHSQHDQPTPPQTPLNWPTVNWK